MSTVPTAVSDAPWAGPEPEFAVLGVRAVPYAAAPMLSLDLQVTENTGREVYMIALGIQLMLEPARRGYDDATRAKLYELFGAPERWGTTTRSLVWARLDAVIPAFTATTTVAVTVPVSFDLELAAAKYLYALPDGMAPMALHFNGTVYYPDDHGSLQMVLVPWSCSADYRMPIALWRETVEHYYPNTGWVALQTPTLHALERRRVTRGLPTYDACLRELLGEGSDD